MIMQIVGAGVGAAAGGWVLKSFILKKEDGSGFVEVTDGIGLDDFVSWLVIGAGAFAGMKLIGKIGV